MKTHTLLRSYLPDRTVGQLVIDGMALATLERPWDDNKVNISCIPEGLYKVTPDATGRHQYYRVNDVPGRTAIEFHFGNKPEHSNGCILLDAEEMKNLIGDEVFMLEIRRFAPLKDKWLLRMSDLFD